MPIYTLLYYLHILVPSTPPAKQPIRDQLERPQRDAFDSGTLPDADLKVILETEHRRQGKHEARCQEAVTQARWMYFYKGRHRLARPRAPPPAGAAPANGAGAADGISGPEGEGADVTADAAAAAATGDDAVAVGAGAGDLVGGSQVARRDAHCNDVLYGGFYGLQVILLVRKGGDRRETRRVKRAAMFW